MSLKLEKLYLSELSDLDITGYTQGSVLFAGSSSVAEDNANLFWDDTNNRLGIGTNVPATLLDVNGIGRFNQLELLDNEPILLGIGQDVSIDYDLANNSLDIDLTGGVNTGLRIITDANANNLVIDGSTSEVEINGLLDINLKDGVFTGANVSGNNVRRLFQISETLTDDTNPFGYVLETGITASGGSATIRAFNGALAVIHSSTGTAGGGEAANFQFQIGSATGSGTVTVGDVTGFQYTLNRRFNIPSALTYNVTNSYGAKYVVQDGGSSTGGVVNVVNYYGGYWSDPANTGGTKRVNITNLYGIYIEPLSYPAVKKYGIVLAGDGAGSDIVFGAGQDASIYYDGTDLVFDPDLVGTGVVSLAYAANALGGGAAATLGTIGGTGPAVAAQNEWLKVKVNGNTRFIPLWA